MHDTVAEEDRFETEFATRFQRALDTERHDFYPRPNLSHAAMSCALVDADGQPAWVGDLFERWVGCDAIDADICRSISAGGGEQIVHTTDRDGNLLLLLYAPPRIARHWPIAPAPESWAQNATGVAIGALSLAHLADDVIKAARALGLNNLEARVAAALVSHGNLRRAAAHAGVTYQTARKAAAEAMAKVNVSSQAALVRKLSELVTSVSPPRETAERLLIDIFGFRRRDARLALLLAQGRSRGEAARIAGTSPSVAKDAFSRIFTTLGIARAPEISRIVADAFTAALLANADRPVLASLPGRQEPLRIFHRPDGSMVATSDYGPTGAEPVLIIHSSMSTRYPLGRLVGTLQRAGFRPITIDRPGFGLTDDVARDGDPFAAGVDDLRLVCDGLGLERVNMVTRGGSFAALALARAHPERIGRVVVINPDLLSRDCSKRAGSLGIARKGFERFPDRIERIARWIAGQLTPSRCERLIRMGVQNSPVDLRAFDDPDNLADYQRSVLVFGTGRISGFIREQRGFALLAGVEGLAEASNWTLLVGETDPLHEIGEILAFWRAKLPGARESRIASAGRFIELTHPDDVIAALKRGAP